MSDKWLVVPYGNAVADGKPESEWDWMVNRDDDSESIEVESKVRAEQIAAFLNENPAPSFLGEKIPEASRPRRPGGFKGRADCDNCGGTGKPMVRDGINFAGFGDATNLWPRDKKMRAAYLKRAAK